MEINAKGIIIGFMDEIGEHAERSKCIDQFLLHYEAVQVTKDSILPSQVHVTVRGE